MCAFTPLDPDTISEKPFSEAVQTIAREVCSCGTVLDRHRDAFNQMGFSLLSDRGADRVAFVGPGENTPYSDSEIVVKVSRNAEASEATVREIECWDSVSGTGFETYFAPVRGGDMEDGRWLAMPRCKMVHHDHAEFLEKLQAEDCPVPVDAHKDNVGLWKKQLVFFDYSGFV